MIYFQLPATETEWKDVAEQFYHRWNYPNCLGAVDGKHVVINPPPKTGSFYFNYKGTHSIILMAVVDAKYKFLYVDVGINGRVSDSSVWNQCSLQRILENSTASIPQAEALPHSERVCPFVFIGDDAFPLKSYMMKPYPFRNQTKQQRIYSYRLSRARRVVENAFGILANRFRVFLAPINLEPAKVETIVLAAVALHNFLISENTSDYVPAGTFDKENLASREIIQGAWRNENAGFLRL